MTFKKPEAKVDRCKFRIAPFPCRSGCKIRSGPHTAPRISSFCQSLWYTIKYLAFRWGIEGLELGGELSEIGGGGGGSWRQPVIINPPFFNTPVIDTSQLGTPNTPQWFKLFTHIFTLTCALCDLRILLVYIILTNTPQWFQLVTHIFTLTCALCDLRIFPLRHVTCVIHAYSSYTFPLYAHVWFMHTPRTHAYSSHTFPLYAHVWFMLIPRTHAYSLHTYPLYAHVWFMHIPRTHAYFHTVICNSCISLVPIFLTTPPLPRARSWPASTPRKAAKKTRQRKTEERHHPLQTRAREQTPPPLPSYDRPVGHVGAAGTKRVTNKSSWEGLHLQGLLTLCWTWGRWGGREMRGETCERHRWEPGEGVVAGGSVLGFYGLFSCKDEFVYFLFEREWWQEVSWAFIVCLIVAVRLFNCKDVFVYL